MVLMVVVKNAPKRGPDLLRERSIRGKVIFIPPQRFYPLRFSSKQSYKLAT
jgi:hypothetical protein